MSKAKAHLHRHAAHPHEKPHHPHWPLAALLFAFVLALGLASVHDPATWIHIRTGAAVLAQKAIPSVDPFSYTVSGRAWTTDSWLADVLFYLVHENFGPRALIFLKAAAAAAGFALLLPLNYASPLTSASVLALGALAAWTGLTETPAVFDLPLLAGLIRLLRPRHPFRGRTLVAAAGLLVLWANLHGSTAFLGVWVVALKAYKASMRAGKGSDRLGHWGLLGAAVAAWLCNPHGASVLGHMFGGAQTSLTAWREPSWLNLWSAFALAGAASCFVMLQQEFLLTITAATLLCLSVVAPDLRPLAALACCPVISLALGHFTKPLEDDLRGLAKWSAAMAALLAAHWVTVTVPLGASRGYAAVSIRGAVGWLQANGVRGRMFNEIESGALLIGAADRPVFVDGRAQLYGADFLRDARGWPSAFAGLSNVYGFDYAVLLNRRAAYPARILDESPDWRLCYADDSALVYVRLSGASGAVAKDESLGPPPANRLWPDALDPALDDPKRRGEALGRLDRWILRAPDSVQALVWKAYALGRIGQAEEAQRLLELANGRRRAWRDPEIAAMLAFALEARGRAAEARRLYSRALLVARRRGDAALAQAVSARLGRAGS